MILIKHVYKVERTKTVRKYSWWKNHHYATTFNWTRFNCSFETLSDKPQNVSHSMSAVL